MSLNRRPDRMGTDQLSAIGPGQALTAYSRSYLQTLLCILALVFTAFPVDTWCKDLPELGERTIRCERSLRVKGIMTKVIPPGKYEWVTVPVATDIIKYTCGNKSKRLLCPIDTTLIKVKRSSRRDKFQVKCFGEPMLIPTAPYPDAEPQEEVPAGQPESG